MSAEWVPVKTQAEAMRRLEAMAEILGKIVALGSYHIADSHAVLRAASEVYRADLIIGGALQPTPWLHCWGWRAHQSLRQAAESWERQMSDQMWDARKAVGPALARGLAPDAVWLLAKGVAPDAPDEALRTIVAEETAWWFRWRSDRGMQAVFAEERAEHDRRSAEEAGA